MRERLTGRLLGCTMALAICVVSTGQGVARAFAQGTQVDSTLTSGSVPTSGVVPTSGSVPVPGLLPTVRPLAPPRLPLEPVAARAYSVLEKHCARCHQAGRLKRTRPAGNFGNVLRLDQIALNPSLVRPGNPDGSRLYTHVLKREMPFDIYQEHGKGAGPSVGDVKSLRDWIESLGLDENNPASASDPNQLTTTAASEPRRGACGVAAKDEIPGAAGALVKIERHLRGLSSKAAKETRFITLRHLGAACSSKREMVVYRQAVIKLLNSLSSAKIPLRQITIDRERMIMVFKLSDLGWDRARWQTLIKNYPYGLALSGEQVSEFQRLTGSALPVVRGDWLAYAASRAPLYSAMLQQPRSAAALQSSLGLDVGADIRSFLAQRGIVTGSRVAANNRLIERHKISSGSYWMTYDFDGSKGRQNLTRYPVGPFGKRSFKHALNAAVYTLPNAFSAYYLSTEDGDKLDVAPDGILSDLRRRGGAVRSAISCMGCHSAGVITVTRGPFGNGAQIFDIKNKAKRLKRSVREAVKGLYPSPDNILGLLEGDALLGREAMMAAGLDPDLVLNGDEPVTALSKRYERAVTLGVAAAELGMDATQLSTQLAALSSQTAKNFLIGRRLSQGVVSRDIFARRYSSLAAMSSLVAVKARPRSGDKGYKASREDSDEDGRGGEAYTWSHEKNIGGTARSFNLSVFSDKSEYKRGDSARFWVVSDTNCNLTLINVGVDGKGTVIFPNDFNQNNSIAAGDVLRLPGASALYKFRMRDAGTEKIIGICNTDVKSADGIEHDFEKQKFTYLGDYARFLAGALNDEVTGRGEVKRIRVRVRRRAGGSRRRSRYKTILKATGTPELQARSAIIIKVR